MRTTITLLLISVLFLGGCLGSNTRIDGAKTEGKDVTHIKLRISGENKDAPKNDSFWKVKQQ